MKGFTRPVVLLAALLASISLSSVVSAFQISGILNGLGENPHPKDLSIKTRVVLSGGEYSAMVTKEGRFMFPNVPEGSYLLEVQSPQYIYPTLKVIVTAKESRAAMVTPGADWSNNDNQLQFPLSLTPRGAASFFIPREGFKVSHLFANPMMLMMGFSVLMLLSNMDPEAMEEMQGQEVPQMPNFEMPDIAATLAKFSTGGGSPQPSSSKKRQ
ncbi:hypothetical protein BG006_000526 [Podila minutissima]|uniref:ER membrane protein complex subunit 7 beta-sandwich domain-containing protein n=1 Tax=Podila minutissima TaxID=64525 RepID=A0A9P5SEU6_9FUNG|nr:hypothetical protein BG006_000526 [Podila minutissima]